MTADVGTALTRLHTSIDVSQTVPPGQEAEAAITVVVDLAAEGPRVVVFAFPGGGYTGAYFDLHRPELSGSSEAEYHASRGWVFVAVDPFGGGASTPLNASQLGLPETSRAADRVVRSVSDRLRTGTLIDGLKPVEIAATIGVGHSLGGMQVIHQQGHERTFDAVAVLGFSAIQTLIPTPEADAIAPHSDPAAPPPPIEAAWSGPLSDDIAHLRYAYHWDDVPSSLVEADMSVGFPVRTATALPPWISATFPPFAAICMSPGVVRREASSIDVPVLVGAGERDVLRNVRAESAAYSSSRDVLVIEVPRCAHMHNFSPQREHLWTRLQAWGDSVPSLSCPVST
jgi:hypothetical protein